MNLKLFVFPKHLCKLVTLVSSCVLFVACSGTPGERDGKRAVEDRIQTQSQGRINLESFKKANGQLGKINSIEVYSLEYEAVIQINQRCRWNIASFAGALMDTEASFRTSPPSDPSAGALAQLMEQTTNPGVDVPGGQRLKLQGAIQFEKKENGWTVDSIKMTSVSPIDVRTVSTGATPPAEQKRQQAQPETSRAASAQTTQRPITAASARQCKEHLRTIATGFRLWAADHHNEFPFNVSQSEGGTKNQRSANADGVDRNTAAHFTVMSVELGLNPGVLLCPADQSHTAAQVFNNLVEENISYELLTGRGVSQGNSGQVLVRCPIHKNKLYCDYHVDGPDFSSLGTKPERSPTAQRQLTRVEAMNACINNLRMLDGAKQQWALEHKKSSADIPSMLDLKPYVVRADGEYLQCPAGGSYTIRNIATAPTCTVPEHELP
jgi:hypothetical protein